MPEPDVLVVGAGPVGLLLAGLLRLGGARVVVLDRLAAPSPESRASTLHAPALALLTRLGLARDWPCLPMGHFGGLPLELPQWKVPQPELTALLAAWATGLGAELRRGHEVTGLEEHTDAVEVLALAERPVRVRAKWVVGCDGERSAIRELSGITSSGTTGTRGLLRADVAGLDLPPRRFQRLPNGVAISGRTPDGVTRVMVHEFGRPPQSIVDFLDLADTWERVTGEHLHGGDPIWLNAFDDTNRQADRYVQGRVLLAGDAAHQQLPVGGQALNLGLADAAALGPRLAEVATSRGPASLLADYHTERHAAGARTLANIRAQTELLFGPPGVEPLRAVFAELLAHQPVRAQLACRIGGTPTTKWTDDTARGGPMIQLTTPAPRHSRILGVGGYRPRRVVPNAEIAEVLGISPGWIATRSGIRERRFAAPEETLPMMAVQAAEQALLEAGRTAAEVDHIVVATCSNRVHVPSLASAVAKALGAPRAGGFDLNAACAGFCYALAAASDAVRLGEAETALVIGVERMRDIVDPTDLGTAFLFADGAGAVVLGPGDTPGIGPAVRGSAAESVDAVRMSSLWADYATGEPEPAPTLRMNGKRVFRWSMTDVLPAARWAVTAAGLTPGDLAAFVPHQANNRMLQILAAELDLSPDAVVAEDLIESGNTSAASIPLALRRLLDDKEISSGDPVLLMGFGAGLTYCGQVVLAP